MLDPRRQVDKVARPGDKGLPADRPAPATAALDEKYVIGVDVRPDAAARGGVTHHHVVEPRLRHERKAPQQFVRGGDVMVHAVDQDAPVLLFRVYPGERAMRGFVAPAA